MHEEAAVEVRPPRPDIPGRHTRPGEQPVEDRIEGLHCNPGLPVERQRAAALNAEIGWRRAEMLHASSEGGVFLKALLAQSALGRRFQGWRERGQEVAT